MYIYVYICTHTLTRTIAYVNTHLHAQAQPNVDKVALAILKKVHASTRCTMRITQLVPIFTTYLNSHGQNSGLSGTKYTFLEIIFGLPAAGEQ